MVLRPWPKEGFHAELDACCPADASKLGDWLEKHHCTATELWVRIFKSDTGVPSVTWNDCVIETTEAKRSLVRTAATLTLSLEDMQAARLRGESVDAGELTRLAGQQRRVLADLRRNTEASVPAALSLLDHLAVSHDDDEGHEEDAD